MKFLCPKCERLVELRDFKLDGAALVVTCLACGAASRVSSASSPPVSLVPLVPLTPVASVASVASTASPSITGERPALQLTSVPGASNVVALRSAGSDAVSSAADSARSGPFEVPAGRCPKCIAPRQPAGLTCSQCGLTFAQFDASQVAPPPWLNTAWVQLLSDWGNEERHAELRQRARVEQDLAAAGRLYRLRLISRPEDPFAQRGRDEVLRMALVPGVEPKPGVMTEKIDAKWKYVLATVFVLICLGLLAFMARAMLSPE